MVIRKPPDAGGSGWETTDPRNVNFFSRCDSHDVVNRSSETDVDRSQRLGYTRSKFN